MRWFGWFRRKQNSSTRRAIPPEVLQRLQQYFHELILENKTRRQWIEKHRLSLPQLEPLLETDKPGWFPIPGMFGGFRYELEGEGAEVKLIVASWSRVVEGSGRRYVITAEGSKLVEEGFV
jgi:hypothetical protein